MHTDEVVHKVACVGPQSYAYTQTDATDNIASSTSAGGENEKKLKADRPHSRDYPHTPY